jgi:hypothetical protein
VRDGACATIDCGGDERVVRPDTELTFGRAADLVVDEANSYLHRLVGRVFCRGGVWLVENLGTHIELDVVGEGGVVSRLPPARPDAPPPVVSLPTPAGAVRFQAGGANYELVVRIGPTGPPPAAARPTLGVETVRPGRIPLTDEERKMLVVLARPVLRDPAQGPESLPASRQVAHELGWPLSKLNRKLDYLCTRLTRAGVDGLHGGRGHEARHRRWRLVEHAINARLVTPADLATAAPRP